MILAFADELKKQKALYGLAGALLFYSFISFYDWSYDFYLTKTMADMGQHSCWPYFQNCVWLYWFDKPPHGFGVNMFFLVVFSLLALSAWAWANKHFKLLWWGLLGVLVFKIFVAYIYTDSLTASYDFYHTFLLALFLFVRGRWFFLQVFMALTYLLSATLKIAPEWFNGEAFTGIGGLPLWDAFMPSSVGAILLFLCFTMLPWCLFLSRAYRAAALVILSLFHLYTVLIVGFHYPSLMIPVLWALFVVDWPARPLFSKNLVGWGLLGLATLFHMWSFVIPGNEKVTGEGVRYGLYMFDSKRYCQSMIKLDYGPEAQWQETSGLGGGRRCYVYREWFYIQQQCKQNPEYPIAWEFKFSNRNPEGPYDTLVKTPNACELEFRPFWHNDWIQLPPEPQPWWLGWVWAFWALNAAALAWVISRLK